jgi:AraC-like DNA-binding protein
MINVASELAAVSDFSVVDDPLGARHVVGLRLPEGARRPGDTLLALHHGLRRLRGDYGPRSVELPGRPVGAPYPYLEAFGAKVRFGRPAALLRLPAGVLSGSADVHSGSAGVLSGPAGVHLGSAGVLSGSAGVHLGSAGVLSGSAGVLSGSAGVLSGPAGVLSGPAGVPGVERSGLAWRVRHALTDRLGSRSTALPDVARAITVHPRTLQRSLLHEGLVFAEILDCVRRERAHALLTGTDLPLAEISARLGFAEPAVLSRCARRWWGHSASTRRQAHG